MNKKEKTKFYIASKLENHEQVQVLAGLLIHLGWEHTYDWTVHESVKESNTETLKSIGQRETDGVKSADIVIVLTPQGRGTHVELGIEIALNKTVYLCHEDNRYFQCDDNTSAFYWLPNVTHFIGGIEELAKKLEKNHMVI
jgi:nucleoside 2-deoxyribosyltransferase